MSDNIEIDRKLWKAASHGDKALVSQLIEQGAEVDWRHRGQYDYTALHEAAKRGHTPVVTRLLDAGWSLEARNRDGGTPLFCAAMWLSLETAKCLLLRGANIDTQDDHMNTPLLRAFLFGPTSSVKLLLRCGANEKIRNSYGKTAQDMIQRDETRALFKKTIENRLNIKYEILKQKLSKKNDDVSITLMFRTHHKELIQMTKRTRTLDGDFLRNQFPWIK